MKKTTLIGITSSTVLLALVSSYIVSNNSLIVSFANTPKSPYSVTFDASNITDDTYCGNDSGTMYLSSKVNTTNDMLDLMLSYSIDGSSYHNQYGRILRYDVSGSWEGKYDLYFTLWKGIDNFTSVELIGSFTDIEDNVSSNITYTESRIIKMLNS